MPLHLIGHSRGGSLVAELARRLGERGVWTDHVTTLDPHPVDGIRDPFGFDFGDAALAAWETVFFWDNYWRTDGDSSLDFTGEAIAGAHDLQLLESVLNDFTGYSNEHSDVHLWYHGTIDTEGPVDDGSASVTNPDPWYQGAMGPRTATGYFYSRVAGGSRPVGGVTSAIPSGTGTRVAIEDHQRDRWPSIVNLELTSEAAVSVEEPLQIRLWWHDWDSPASVSFFLDADRNPYNGAVQQLGDEEPLPQTAPTPIGEVTLTAHGDGVAPGEYFLRATIGDGERFRHAYLPNVVTFTTPPPITVSGLVPTASGFVVEFSEKVAPDEITLFGDSADPFSAADVILIGERQGPIPGTLLVGPESRAVTFVRPGPPLAADNYLVTVRSGVDGVQDESGTLLDGDGDGIPGGDFVSSFAVSESVNQAVTLEIPDAIRGPGQPLDIPANGASGMPLVVRQAEGLRALELQLGFNPNMFQIVSAAVDDDAPARASVEMEVTESGLATLLFNSPTALAGEETTIIRLEGQVPPNAPYGQQTVLAILAATASDEAGTAMPVVVDTGVHLVSYFGDVSGNGRVNASDAAQVARFAALLDRGFSASRRTDPLLIADVSGNFRVNAADASKIAQFAALVPVPEIPSIPAPLTAEVTGRAATRIPAIAFAEQRPADDWCWHTSAPPVNKGLHRYRWLVASVRLAPAAVDELISSYDVSPGRCGETPRLHFL